MSGTEKQAEEIRRLLHCSATKADAFSILQLDPESCELTDINRSFRKIVLNVHPDKCTLAKAADAFHVAENAHKLLSDEAILVRLKIAHRRKKEREAALKDEASRRQAGVTTVGGTDGSSDGANITKEERMRRRRREQLEEQQLEAARLAEEAARKKERVERVTKERAELAAELERQRKEWKSLNLF